jgi:hypothetical protein
MARRASAEAIQSFKVGGPGLLRLRLRSLGFGGQVGGQVARNDVTGRTISFPRRHCVRALHRNCPSGNRGRREGRVPAAPAAPVHQKARGRNHRWRRSHPAFPAQWCYGLYALSPGTGLSCPRCPQAAHRAYRKLSLSVGRPGPHDFAVRVSISRLAQST